MLAETALGPGRQGQVEAERAPLSFPSPGVSLGSPSTATWNLVEKKNPLAVPDHLPSGDSQETQSHGGGRSVKKSLPRRDQIASRNTHMYFVLGLVLLSFLGVCVYGGWFLLFKETLHNS